MKVKRNLVGRLDIFKTLNATKIIKINPKDIIVAEWVRIKCMYGCSDFGENLTCPPYSPDLEFVRKFLNCYSAGLLIQFDLNLPDKKDRWEWSRQINMKLLEIEKQMFLKGNYKAWTFTIGDCKICKNCCKDMEKCPSMDTRRSTPESFGIDVFGTAKKYGITLEVKKSCEEPFKYITFLLIR